MAVPRGCSHLLLWSAQALLWAAPASGSPPHRDPLLTRRALSLGASTTALALARPPALANWLSSEPVERFRRLEQELADAKYGELAPIDDGTGNARRLAPIVELLAIVEGLEADARDPAAWPALRDRMRDDPRLQTPRLKKAFNFYSDNIYYTDDQRANIYLLGGATPETAQTEQYLLRNEVLTAVGNARLELDYLCAEAAKEGGDRDDGDLKEYLGEARKNIAEYIKRAPERDRKAAIEIASREAGGQR
mmetsp:Transcript_24145/g.81155  ORF Transcript_24145/g.81155 Transcript_24145/m.81155 type:complete len:250 (+) Transcript_24145:25-774(+)